MVMAVVIDVADRSAERSAQIEGVTLSPEAAAVTAGHFTVEAATLDWCPCLSKLL